MQDQSAFLTLSFTSPGLLHLAGDLVGHALGLGPSVAGRLAGSLFDRALDLLGQTGDLILVHHVPHLLGV